MRFGSWVVVDRFIPRFVGPDEFMYCCRCACGNSQWFKGKDLTEENVPVCEECLDEGVDEQE